MIHIERQCLDPVGATVEQGDDSSPDIARGRVAPDVLESQTESGTDGRAFLNPIDELPTLIGHEVFEDSRSQLAELLVVGALCKLANDRPGKFRCIPDEAVHDAIRPVLPTLPVPELEEVRVNELAMEVRSIHGRIVARRL